VHRWRSEESAIMVGSRTVMLDNPYLTNRSGMGPQPVRVVLDRKLSLKKDFHLFDGTVKTIILNEIKNEEGLLIYSKLDPYHNLPDAVSAALLKNKIQSVLIEGGAQILSFFLQSGCWDESRVITNSKMKVGKGVPAPVLLNATLHKEDHFGDDIISYFYNYKNQTN